MSNEDNQITKFDVIEQAPTQYPVNMDSTTHESLPNLNNQLDMGFHSKENQTFENLDPLSSKDPNEEDEFQTKKNKVPPKFDGTWKDNQFEGEGTFHFKNGDYFKGKEWLVS
jgi:hypothetical protein